MKGIRFFTCALLTVSASGCAPSTQVDELNKMLSLSGVPNVVRVEDIEILDRSSTALGNSGHKSLRATLSPESFESFLRQATAEMPTESQVQIAFSELGLTIDPSQATYNTSKHFEDGGGVVVLADENDRVIEVAAWW